MEKQVISEKIISDANAKAQSIVETSLSDVESLLSQASLNAEKAVQEARLQAEKDGQLLIERRKTLAKLDAKKMVLDSKQALIARAFAFAQNKLTSLSSGEYLDFIERLLNAHAEKGDVVLLCQSALVSEGQISSLKIAKDLLLSVKRGENFGGGIKLLGEKCDKDLSFGAIIDDYARKNTQEISAMIFK